MFVDALFFFAGFYMLVLTVKMKKTGEVSSQLIGKKIDLNKVKDLPGYINVMYPVNLIFGGLLLFTSCLGMIKNIYSLPVWVDITVLGLYCFGIIFYGAVSVKNQKKYLM
ncbi:MAG: hypothetical protein MJ123_11095 [Lachnospiraceae bacterium]|nr:hypothetical protein [Lachnospiraceae bacterium]